MPGGVCAHAGEIVPAQAELRGGGAADGAAGVGGEEDGEVSGQVGVLGMEGVEEGGL